LLDREEILLRQVHRLAALPNRRCEEALVDQGWTVPRPHGCFNAAAAVGKPRPRRSLSAAGIVVRPLRADDGIRISIGESQSVDKLLKGCGGVGARTPAKPVRAPR
jgi:histidinol-phosphate aminotransferase